MSQCGGHLKVDTFLMVAVLQHFPWKSHGQITLSGVGMAANMATSKLIA